MGDGADVVLVSVSDQDAAQPVAPLGDEGRIGQDQIDAGRHLVGERHAAIDHEPLAVAAEQAHVHADLVGAAERHEQELARPRVIRGVGHFDRFRRLIWARPRKVRSGSRCWITFVASAKSGASPPVAITVMSAPNSDLMRATRPSISPT